MIHPLITRIFQDNDESAELFALICKNITDTKRLQEFIKLHLQVNKEVIKEITNTQGVNFSDDTLAKRWAEEFLKNYDIKIRNMRDASNQVFEKFHQLKNNEFKKIISEYGSLEIKITDLMNIFLNKKELLIGKIIFAYRETWFLANQISDPSFKIGSVTKYKQWVEENLVNLMELDKSLDVIYNTISNQKR